MQQVREMARDIYWVGALNANLRWFDIVMRTDHGTSYNAYIIKGEKTALIDAVHKDFGPEFLDKVKAVADPAKIDYIVVNHTEMDHTGCLGDLLELAPQAEIVSTKSAANLLSGIVNKPFKSRIVAEGDRIDLGNGRTLRFIISPFWHWPDTMFTYLEEDGILFPCDGFATHYCDERLFDDRVGDFGFDMKYYFDHIMRPFKQKIREGCAKVRALNLNMIAPSHGPILRTDPWRYVERYEEWSKPPEKPGKEITVLYASAYGATKEMALRITEGIEAKGVGARLLDVAQTDMGAILDAIERSDGILLGSPTLNRDAVKPVWDVISMLVLIDTKGKKWGVFGSYGWSGEGTKLLAERLKSLRMDVWESRMTAILLPDSEELGKCVEYGREFADQLL